MKKTKPTQLGLGNTPVVVESNKITTTRPIDQPRPVVDRPVTPKQLATFLQVSPRTISRLLKRQDFPRLAIGNRVRFMPNDVIDYFRKKK